jgi:hypothetical protein
MARISRTQTALTGPPEVSVQSRFQQHAVAQTAGKSAGVDPNAGNLASAFSSFFSSLSNTTGQMAQGAHNLEMRKIEIQKVESRKAGAAQASADYASGRSTTPPAADPNEDPYPDDDRYERTSMTPGSSPADAGLSEEQRNNAAFMGAYTSQRARLMGHELVQKIERDTSGVAPENWNSAAQAAFSEYYGKGSGDATFDSEITNVWDNYYQQRSDVKLGEAVAATRAEAAATLSNEVTSFVRGPMASTLGQDEFDGWVAQAQSINPALSVNQARAHVLKTMSTSIQGRDSLLAMQSFLSRPYSVSNEDGSVSTEKSFEELFPAAAAQLSEDAQQRYDTQTSIEAREAYGAFSLDVAAAQRESDWRTQAEMVNTLMQRLPQLESLYGNSNGAHTTNSTALTKMMTDIAEKHLAVNGLQAVAATGAMNDQVTPENVETHQLDWIRENANFLGDPNHSPLAWANGISQHFRTTSKVSTFAQNYIASGFTSGDPDKIQRSQAAVEAFVSQTNASPSQLLGNDTASLAMYLSIKASNDANIGPNTADIATFSDPLFVSTREGLVRDPARAFGLDVSDARTAAEKEALVQSDFFDEVSDELDTAFFRFGNASMDVRMTEAVRAFAILEQTKATMRGRPLSTSDLVARTTEAFKSSTLQEGSVLSLYQGIKQYSEDPNDSRRDIVPYGIAVPNPRTGKVENTQDNVRRAVQDIEDGFIGARFKINGEFVDVDGGDLQVRPDSYTSAGNRLIIEHRDTGAPLTLIPGQSLQTSQLYDPASTRGQPNFASRRSWYQSTPDSSITLTGDPEADAAALTAAGALHPSISLVPTYIGGQVSFYELAVTPFFAEGHDARTQSEMEEVGRTGEGLGPQPDTFTMPISP